MWNINEDGNFEKLKIDCNYSNYCFNNDQFEKNMIKKHMWTFLYFASILAAEVQFTVKFGSFP